MWSAWMFCVWILYKLWERTIYKNMLQKRKKKNKKMQVNSCMLNWTGMRFINWSSYFPSFDYFTWNKWHLQFFFDQHWSLWIDGNAKYQKRYKKQHKKTFKFEAKIEGIFDFYINNLLPSVLQSKTLINFAGISKKKRAPFWVHIIFVHH